MSLALKSSCVTFFNEADRNTLMTTPRITDRVADFIISSRPFMDYEDLGLGKTIQVIAFLTHLKSQQIFGPHLIVVPSSTIENWLSEFANWSPGMKIITYYGSIADRRQLRHMAADRNVCSFCLFHLLEQKISLCNVLFV
ncbi:unnamed protein product [Gongylonema pulchrum]|uniref:SNF2_N domain-containing protein n=1 Tax=Gongylonema pulchrum TaxID=637853 RepID=A0A183DBK0_9BILA|nr:unnamed protein product [Gongylonema pulchrum]